MKDLIFRKANIDEVENCFNLIKDRIDWMNSKKINHWNSFDYLGIYSLDHFKRIQNEGDLYVLLDKTEVVAVGALLQKDERWKEDNNDSLYLHHFASKISEEKYGEEFLCHAFDYALSVGKTYFKLDSKKGYKPLDDYYERFGFVKVEEFKEADYVGELKQLKLSNKKELRQKIKSIKLDKEYIENSSLIIQRKVIDSLDYKNSKNIFVYISTSNEVKTDLLINDALKNHKNVYVPLCDETNMKAVLINENTKFVENKYHILEPQEIIEEAKEIDLSIIPCLSANNSLRRLGHGKGYYDRFLNKYNCVKYVLCFSLLTKKYIPMDEHDVYMDKLIEEKN